MSINEEAEMPEELHESIREYLNGVFEDNDEVLTEYFIVAASRTLENGGRTILATNSGIPPYVVEGMLRCSIRLINEVG